MVAIDDQLFETAAIAAGREAARAQGVTLDNDSVTWFVKFNAWEAGVIPIEFADDAAANAMPSCACALPKGGVA